MRFLCVLLLLAAPLAAQERALVVAADAALLVDAAQTATFLARGVDEGNPVLGRHPSAAGLVAYNAAWLAVNSFAPRPLRRWVNLATLVVEVGFILHNRPYARWP